MPDLNNKTPGIPVNSRLEKILIQLIDMVTLGNGEPLTDVEVVHKAFAKKRILELINQEKEALVDEIMDVAMDMGHDYELTIVLQKYELKSRRDGK